MRYRVNTVASAVARGWPVRELKRTKTTWTPGRFNAEELQGKWVTTHELDAGVREGRVGGPGGHEEEGGGGGEGVGVAEMGVDGGGEGGAEVADEAADE
ncbi:hypothetical protein NL676_001146 [Syzygium grande]|nr:hypothetical protein NL676_001146 [Syzygium grande]